MRKGVEGPRRRQVGGYQATASKAGDARPEETDMQGALGRTAGALSLCPATDPLCGCVCLAHSHTACSRLRDGRYRDTFGAISSLK